LRFVLSEFPSTYAKCPIYSGTYTPTLSRSVVR
jgi:hypothetical protein